MPHDICPTCDSADKEVRFTTLRPEPGCGGRSSWKPITHSLRWICDDSWHLIEPHAPATPAPYASYDEIRRRLKAVIGWLEKNQPDVFKRGLWDVIEVAEAAPTTPELKSRLEKIIEEVKALKSDREALIHALTCPLDWCDKCKPADDILRARGGAREEAVSRNPRDPFDSVPVENYAAWHQVSDWATYAIRVCGHPRGGCPRHCDIFAKIYDLAEERLRAESFSREAGTQEKPAKDIILDLDKYQ